MAENGESRTPEEMASQQINATNPDTLALKNASAGGIGDTSKAAERVNQRYDAAEDGDDNGAYMQLMYEQSAELDGVDRIRGSRNNGLGGNMGPVV